MSVSEGIGRDEHAAPLPAPVPGTEFKRLSRGQSILAWAIGWIVGLTLAAGAILVLVLR